MAMKSKILKNIIKIDALTVVATFHFILTPNFQTYSNTKELKNENIKQTIMSMDMHCSKNIIE